MFVLAALWIFFICLCANIYKCHICPTVFLRGIPLRLYGGNLFPIALRKPYTPAIVTPFWANLGGGIREELRKWIASNKQAKNCFLFNELNCTQDLRTQFKQAFGPWVDYYRNDNYYYYFTIESDPMNWELNPLDDNTEDLIYKRRYLLLQCLYWCHTIIGLPEEQRPKMTEICPNPCLQDNVCYGAGTVDGSCKLTGEGFFVGQIECSCQPNFAWSKMHGACVQENPCDRKNPVCDPNGTLSCSFDSDLNEVSCFCKPDFMGEDCSSPANACEELLQNPLLLNGGQVAMGNRACNVNNDGNQCITSSDPLLGPVYACICKHDRWTRDATLGYDNCIQRVTKCNQIICVKGRCIDSRDGRQAVCLCDPGYGSEHCTVWVGIWSMWSPWGKCSPSCGSERWAVRTRKCLVEEQIQNPERFDCNGSTVEFAPCEPHLCSAVKNDILTNYFGFREQVLMITLLLATVTATGLALVWQACFGGKLANWLWTKPPADR